MKIRVLIDADKCGGCGFCYEACPWEVYEIDDEKHKAVVVNERECIACRNCEEVCPTHAITIEETWNISPYLHTYKRANSIEPSARDKWLP